MFMISYKNRLAYKTSHSNIVGASKEQPSLFRANHIWGIHSTTSTTQIRCNIKKIDALDQLFLQKLIKWYHHVWNDKVRVRRTTGQPHLSAIVQERLPERPRTTWMKTIQQDLKSNNLSLNEAIDVAKNRPLWRPMSTFGAKHS